MLAPNCSIRASDLGISSLERGPCEEESLRPGSGVGGGVRVQGSCPPALQRAAGWALKLGEIRGQCDLEPGEANICRSCPSRSQSPAVLFCPVTY